MTDVATWKRQGAIKPTPATQHLWELLAEAKRVRDYPRMGNLSGDIRKATVEAGKDRR